MSRIVTATNFATQVKALCRLNIMVLLRSPSSYIAGILVPCIVIGIALGMSAAIQANIPNITTGATFNFPILDYPPPSQQSYIAYLLKNDSQATLWQERISPALSSGLRQDTFRRFTSYAELSDDIWKTKEAPELGVNLQEGEALLGGYTLLHGGSNGAGGLSVGFLRLLQLMNQALTGLPIQTGLGSFPALFSERVDVSSGIIPSFQTFGFAFFITFFAIYLIRDKEEGHYGLLRISGITPTAYYTAAFIRDFVLYLIPYSVYLILNFTVRPPVIISTPLLPWILTPLLAAPPLILYSYLLSLPFKQSINSGPILGITVAVIVFVPYFVTSFIVGVEQLRPWHVVLVSLIAPSYGLNRALEWVAQSSVSTTPLTASTIWKLDGFFLPIILVFILDTFLYSFLLLRADAWFHQRKVGKTAAAGSVDQTMAAVKDEEVKHHIQELRQTTHHSTDWTVRILDLVKAYELPDQRTIFGKISDKLRGRPNKSAQKTVLKGVSIGVRPSECLGYLGPNGAGKSTTINILTGLEPSTSGEVTINGYSVAPNYDAINIPKLLGVCPQHSIIWPRLSAREHLTIFAWIKGVTPAAIPEQVKETAAMVALAEDLIDKPAGGYSGGNKRKLSIAMAVVGKPPAIFLDEPTTGIDIGSRQQVWECIRKLKQTSAVVLTTHSMEEAEVLCDRIGILLNGTIQALGTAGRLKNTYGSAYRVLVKTSSPSLPLVSELSQTLAESGEVELKQQLGCYYELEIGAANAGVTEVLSRVFAKLEQLREDGKVLDFSVGQTTLAQVFVEFVKQQHSDQLEEEEGK